MKSFTLILTIVSVILSVAEAQTCKCRPTESCWPSTQEWSNLNQTMQGRLMKAVPAASVCYGDHPNYNATACVKVRNAWFGSPFHTSDPISVGTTYWYGNSCPPIYENGTSVTGNPNAGRRGCKLGWNPEYVVNATDASHVVAAVKFAKDNNIRLVIKNTGHSYLGRSTGYGSLSIWTHNWKRMIFHDNFQPENCPLEGSDGQPMQQMAVTATAGIQDLEMYKFADQYKAAVVGGANPTVGVMGWFSGGGHGPMSSDYGMGADNVLQATVVTPDGEIVVTNACQHPDLFFAIRGGGGSTFGVILDVTMKAYPTPKTQTHALFMSSRDAGYNSTRRFWETAAFILSEFPRLKEGGMQGYFGFRSGSAPRPIGDVIALFTGGKQAPPTRILSMYWSFYLYNKKVGLANELVAPIKKRLDEEKEFISYSNFAMPQVNSFWASYGRAPAYEPMAAGNGWMGGWLMPRSGLQNLTRLADVLELIGPSTHGPASTHITGHFSSPNPNPQLDDSLISMNPAWRESVMDLIPWHPYAEGSSREEISESARQMTEVKMRALSGLAPESGAYFNECDTHQPDWQRAFWGDNYDRLLEIKRKYDPDDVFWCRNCVGNDRWIPQADGGICLDDE